MFFRSSRCSVLAFWAVAQGANRVFVRETLHIRACFRLFAPLALRFGLRFSSVPQVQRRVERCSGVRELGLERFAARFEICVGVNLLFVGEPLLLELVLQFDQGLPGFRTRVLFAFDLHLELLGLRGRLRQCSLCLLRKPL
jgi:hypothetical protein